MADIIVHSKYLEMEGWAKHICLWDRFAQMLTRFSKCSRSSEYAMPESAHTLKQQLIMSYIEIKFEMINTF